MNYLRRLLFFSMIFLPFLSFSQTQDLRVEPPSWWVGMNNPSLQLMLHGKDIGSLSVLIDHPDIILKEVQRVENPNYLFLDLEIPSELKIRKKKDKKSVKEMYFTIILEDQRMIVAEYSYKLEARTEGSANRPGFDNSDVIYLLMPDRFSNADPANDDTPGSLEKADRSNPNGRHGGDIQGIINHLDYIKELGATAFWVNPVLENNMPAYSYHGYAITDFYKVDDRFGGNDVYLDMINECHEKDIKVIMDLVFNHCGSYHWWMEDLPQQDWIHQFPEFTRSNYRSETVMDPYASDYDKAKMISGWFDKTMPDLNQHNEYLANYLIQNTIWWVEYAGLDGIRMDTYPYSYQDVMREWMKRIRAEYPNFNVVGETWLQKEAHTAYFLEDSASCPESNSFLTTVTDFPMHFALTKAMNEKDGWTEGLARLYYVLTHDYLYSNPMSTLVFADNHDLDRFYSGINENLDKWKMAMAFLATSRGIPMLYYGTEILMTGEEHQGHGFIREDFPGGWPDDEINAFVASGRMGDKAEAFDYLKNILQWRKGNEVIHTGRLKQWVPEDGVYVYFRYSDDEVVMVVMNNNDEDKEINPDKFREVLGEKSIGTNIIGNSKIDFSGNPVIPANSAWIIEFE